MTTHIFDETRPWPNKVNFIDSNNCVLGYSMSQDCCESFGRDDEPTSRSSWVCPSCGDQVCVSIKECPACDLLEAEGGG